MKTVLLSSSVILGLVLVLLVGCTSFITVEPGMTADPEARIALVEGDKVKGIWQGKDLQVEYAVDTSPEHLSFSGRLLFGRALLNSFPIVDHFTLRLNILDSDGRVITSSDITPLYSFRNTVDESKTLAARVIRPAGATAIAFNYFGVFLGQVNEEAGGDSWEIFQFPFQRSAEK
ncbi:MAG: hypothetical protein EHM37_18545 [Deltaproteobacteria bacterium]|jgi:hypothetical protein|nr:MAG: hypothetical protein EHM37_18545 [Deltaproteobacteria bacterium]